MFPEERAVKYPDNDPWGSRAKRHLKASDPFIIWVAIVSIGLIVLSIALRGGINPDVSILASP